MEPAEDLRDRAQKELEHEFPGWQIWYVPLAAGGERWCARPNPGLECGDADTLREKIREAHEAAPTEWYALASRDEYATVAGGIPQAGFFTP